MARPVTDVLPISETNCEARIVHLDRALLVDTVQWAHRSSKRSIIQMNRGGAVFLLLRQRRASYKTAAKSSWVGVT